MTPKGKKRISSPIALQTQTCLLCLWTEQRHWADHSHSSHMTKTDLTRLTEVSDHWLLFTTGCVAVHPGKRKWSGKCTLFIPPHAHCIGINSDIRRERITLSSFVDQLDQLFFLLVTPDTWTFCKFSCGAAAQTNKPFLFYSSQVKICKISVSFVFAASRLIKWRD